MNHVLDHIEELAKQGSHITYETALEMVAVIRAAQNIRHPTLPVFDDQPDPVVVGLIVQTRALDAFDLALSKLRLR